MKKKVDKELNERPQTAEELISDVYDRLFDDLCAMDYDFHDITVSVTTMQGMTIRISWAERNKLLREEEIDENSRA